MRKKFTALMIVALLGTTAFLSFRPADDNYFEVSRNIDIFATLFRELNIYYVDDTDPAMLVRRGIDSMLAGLDPYTQYIPESELDDYRYLTTGQYGGIGALIGQRNKEVVITDPYEGFPAQKAGVMAGDRIVEIDGISVTDKTYDEVSKMLKGAPKSTVVVKFERPSTAEPVVKTIVRDEITIKNVPFYAMLNNQTGYIRLSGFTDDAGDEVKDAFDDLKKNNNLKSLILDLRGNPGGLLNEAVNVVNVFVDKGQEVVSTRGRVKELNRTYRTLNSASDVTIPVVVLVNSGSASAAEIVAGSLQDLDRAIVIGQRTFGKGLVQSTRPLSYNAQLKITTSKYYIPSGRCIQAVDYAHRNADGSVGKVPDSLITSFKTKSGRKVLDGGGITPDFTTEVPDLSAIATSLIARYLIFDYATQFRIKNAQIAPAREFTVSDSEYEAFKTWLSDKEYDYETESEQKLAELKAEAEKENYFASISNEFDQVRKKLMHDKTQDLLIHKKEITGYLANEIVSRYYFQNGRMENSFDDDPDVILAVKALGEPSVYSSILNRSYKP